jgi:hypothetical protein
MKAYRFERESRMGTGGEWVEAILSGVFWGGAMLLWDLWSGSGERMKQVLSSSSLLGLALLSLTFGIATTFRWKAFRWPLILVVSCYLCLRRSFREIGCAVT